VLCAAALGQCVHPSLPGAERPDHAAKPAGRILSVAKADAAIAIGTDINALIFISIVHFVLFLLCFYFGSSRSQSLKRTPFHVRKPSAPRLIFDPATPTSVPLLC